MDGVKVAPNTDLPSCRLHSKIQMVLVKTQTCFIAQAVLISGHLVTHGDSTEKSALISGHHC